MKKILFILTLVTIGAFIALNTGCKDDDPVEACEQDLFCDNTVEVTACCTDGEDCYYTYEGVKYSDTDQGLRDLVEALDCSTTKSISVDGPNADMVIKLKSLLESAKSSSLR